MIKNTPPKISESKLKNTIDMVTKLFVYILKADTQVSLNEINILYSMLTNLFSQLDVSWETYVRQIIESSYDIDEVMEYLDKHLSMLDKIRVLQSMIVMAKSEAEFAISDITEIIELCNKMSISADVMIPFIDKMETEAQGNVIISCQHHVTHIRHSIFTDYVIFGSGTQADIRFRNESLQAYECAIYAIEDIFFLTTGSSNNILLNNSAVEFNSITLLCANDILSLGGKEYPLDTIGKIYTNRDTEDDIVFRKPNYDFVIYKQKHWYSVIVSGGSLSQNGRELTHGKRHEIYYDDTMQIKGYAPFHLGMVIESRSSIGVDNIKPNELFITKDKDYWHITRVSTPQSFIQILLKEDGYYLIPPKKQSGVYVNRLPVLEPVLLNLNSDIISIEKRNFRINSFFDLIETPLEIQRLDVIDVKHYYPDGQLALDSISFTAEKGQMIGIMGQSGCGKSTLTKVLSTEIIPTWGNIFIDGRDLSANSSYFMEHLGYVPQEDLLYPNLTVFENLWYRLRLRMPQLSLTNLAQKVENIINQVNLNHHRDTKVGDLFKKNLSGGERKRLNIALELLFEPTIIICDEPTSGLSFNEAEQIVDILASLSTQGKIVIITIHQPNSSLFRKFDRILMMDMGGRMAYYGAPQASFDYFDDELSELTVRKNEIDKKRHLLTSDYFYDVITYPEYNEQNEPVYEQVNRQITLKRKFPPEYWRDKYKRKILFEMIHSDVPTIESATLNPKKSRKRRALSGYFNHFKAFISRSFKMKMRNRTNNIITFVEAPLLALIISFILRHTTSGSYTYADNNNIFIYIFVAIITFIFLGMSNSIEEILSERKIILRERLMNLKMSYYLISKLVTLSIFSIIQALLFHQIASIVLGIKGLYWINIGFLFLASLTGFSLGLLCSAIIREGRAVINILPLILIPQIIFGGAVIEFERMNRSLTIFERHPIPEIVQIIPSRWLFEGLATSYAKNTMFHKALAKTEKNELTHIHDYRNAVISKQEFDELRFRTYTEKIEIAKKWNPDKILNTNLNAAVSVMDGRALNRSRNEFMSSYKFIGNRRLRTWNFNSIVIMFIMLCMNLVTWIRLKYYFKD